jgi:hypothetical protein
MSPIGTPQLDKEQIAWLSNAVAEYILAQRARYAPRAAPPNQQQQTAMTGFFTDEILSTRILALEGERVQNPDFYPALEALGFRNLPDQSTMGAITLVDVVVSHTPFDNDLLFHELVHVEQYRQLGIERFSELYVIGFLTGGCYERIPLEMHAYALGDQYEASPHQFFSVQDAVRDYIRGRAY